MLFFHRKLRYAVLIPAMLLTIFATACRDESPPASAPEKPARRPGCQGCHQEARLDARHDMPCTTCHAGNSNGSTPEQAHAGLIATPAHPEQMDKACGGCHPAQVTAAAASLHFTLKNEVNTVRLAFGAKMPLRSLTEIPAPETIASPLDLADDLLRRRCLSCHVHSAGDGYTETRRGTGCAACHLPFAGGRMTGHAFVRTPPDTQCLHCHYGNRVGSDYHGRFEHDFNLEYRTPYRASGTENRPYGVEFHQLAPDIHQQAGMACVDCHSGAELMGLHGAAKGPVRPISCQSCHDWRHGLPLPGGNFREEKGGLILRTRLTGKELPVPKAVHPAHREFARKAACLVCHAQWTYNDQGVHLVRTGQADDEAWTRLLVQGSREVEDQLAVAQGEPLSMRDKLSGRSSSGLWLLGYGLRRWENPVIGPGPDGRLQVFRPVMDLRLSMVDREQKPVFDNLAARTKHRGYLPYTPHTVGKAGAFYRQRLIVNLPLGENP